MRKGKGRNRRGGKVSKDNGGTMGPAPYSNWEFESWDSNDRKYERWHDARVTYSFQTSWDMFECREGIFEVSSGMTEWQKF